MTEIGRPAPTELLAPGAEEPPVERREPMTRAQPLWQEPKLREAPEERRESPSFRPARPAVQTLSPRPRGASPC